MAHINDDPDDAADDDSISATNLEHLGAYCTNNCKVKVNEIGTTKLHTYTHIHTFIPSLDASHSGSYLIGSLIWLHINDETDDADAADDDDSILATNLEHLGAYCTNSCKVKVNEIGTTKHLLLHTCIHSGWLCSFSICFWVIDSRQFDPSSDADIDEDSEQVTKPPSIM
jgi:hypothetical protein